MEQSSSSAYADLYKAKPLLDQNKRREVLLSEQKRRRNEVLDEARGLDVFRNITNSKPKNYICKKYRNKIMLSEWLVEVPEDFDVSWFMKICPGGHRNIVIAHRNSTKSFSKSGCFEYKFNSALPGGFSCNDNMEWKTTILDCIWSPKTESFYVLDVLMWSDYDLTEYDAEFRFFWLHSKIYETPELQTISQSNTYRFHYVPHFHCDYLTIKNNLDKFPWYDDNTPAVDGLLFYHKEASYTAGRTPLVNWLKPYMVPEILKVNVAEEYLATRPEKYVNLVEHIQHSKKLRNPKKSAMDTS